MNFKGRLLLPNESGPGLRVDLDVAEHHLAVESATGGLGAWPLEVVDIRRLQGDIFAMTVAGEDLHFIADDAISFAYSGLPAISRVVKKRGRSAMRGWLDRIWNGPHEDVRTPPPPMPGEEPSVVAEEPLVFLEEEELMSQPVQSPSSDAETALDIDWFELEPSRDELVEDPADWTSCRALRLDGLPCQSPILTSSGYCVAHDPNRSVSQGYQAAQEARVRLKTESTARLNRVYARLDKAMRQVERGELDPEVAMAMAQLARTMCAILDLDDNSGPSTEAGRRPL